MQSQLDVDAAVASLAALNTRNEVAAFLRCRPRFVSKLVDEGELTAVQRRARGVGSRMLIPRESIRAYLERCAR